MTSIEMKEAIESLMKVYGPFAFGVLSLLVIWLAIIQPELDRKGLDFEAQRQMLQQHQEVLNRQDMAMKALETTAVILDRVTQRLERMQGDQP